MLTYFIAYLCCGIIVGFCAGLFGIGGGIIGIPALLVLFSMQNMPIDVAMHMAIGTLLATAFVTSVASIYTHYQKGMILFSVFKKIVIGAVLGSILGIIIANHLHGIYLQYIFAFFLLFIAIRMIIGINTKEKNITLPSDLKVFIATVGVGAVSGMLGLGGGVLMVPFLNTFGIPLRNAIATTSACILPVTLVGFIGYMIPHVDFSASPGWNTGFVYWPAFIGISLTSMIFAPLGARATHVLPTDLLRKVFAAFLLFIAISILWKGGVH